MTEYIKEIASRLKELREIEGLTVEDLSKDIGVSTAKIAEYESGAVDIPIGFLTKVAGRYQVDVAELITGEQPRLHMYSLCRAGKGINVERVQEYEYQALAYKFAHKKCEPYLVTVRPDEEKPPYINSHEGHEFDYLLEGDIDMIIEDRVIPLHAGDCIYLDSKYRHALKSAGGEAKFLAIVLP